MGRLNKIILKDLVSKVNLFKRTLIDTNCCCPSTHLQNDKDLRLLQHGKVKIKLDYHCPAQSCVYSSVKSFVSFTRLKDVRIAIGNIQDH